jgi:polysaccharide export outer membrane protein
LVLAPRALWSALSADERESILRHELAHLRRRDLQNSLLALLAALPQWFNPLVRMAVRRFDEAGEWACDDAAAKCSALAKREGNHLAERDDYTCARLAFANVLLQAAECVLGEAALPGGQSLRGGVLARRIQRLVNPRFKEESMMKKSCLLALFFVTAIVPLVRIERVSGDDEAARPLPASKVAPQECKPLTVAEFMKRPRGINPERRAAAEKSDYVIEPPDVLLIEGLKLAPKSSLRLGAHDEILILAATGARLRIDGTYTLDIEGEVNLGDKCGRVRLAGLTTKEAEGLIQEKLTGEVGKVNVSVTLHTGMNTEQIAGRHLVAMDGRVNLGDFGTVYVAGMTPSKARVAIEQKLSERLEKPEMFVEVASYNSKVAYVILEGGVNGDEVTRVTLPFPLTSETNVGSLLKDMVLPYPLNMGSAQLALKRPAVDDKGKEKIRPIEWDRAEGKPTDRTNYPVLPGDRICITPIRFSWEATPSESPSSCNADKPASTLETGMMQLHVAFVEDADGTLADIDELKQHGAMIGDSKMALSLLRILEKHKLVTKTGSPRLMFKVGESAAVEISDEKNPLGGLKVNVETRQEESQLILVVGAEQGIRERRCELVLNPQQRKTIIMRLDEVNKDQASKSISESAKYVFVTPEFVDDSPGSWMRP